MSPNKSNPKDIIKSYLVNGKYNAQRSEQIRQERKMNDSLSKKVDSRTELQRIFSR